MVLRLSSLPFALATLFASQLSTTNASGLSLGHATSSLLKRDNYPGFDDPRVNGGLMLTVSSLLWSQPNGILMHR